MLAETAPVVAGPALPADVKTLTLSYAFFRNDTLTAEANAAAP